MNGNSLFKIKRNDTLPALQVSIAAKGNLGQKIGFDLSDVKTATFTMVDNCSNAKVYDQMAQIICSSGGTIQYNWQEGDTDTIGLYTAEFELIFYSGGRLSIPTQGGIKIEILKDIDPF